MKPARSPHSTGCFLVFAQTSSTVATTSGDVVTVGTTSTSFITVAGLNQCRPTTYSGRDVSGAHSVTGSLEVVVARTAPGFITSSNAPNSAFFTVRSSAT